MMVCNVLTLTGIVNGLCNFFFLYAGSSPRIRVRNIGSKKTVSLLFLNDDKDVVKVKNCMFLVSAGDLCYTS